MPKKSRLQVAYDIQKQTGITPTTLTTLKRLPPETAHLWEWYQDISTGRQTGMGGMCPLAWEAFDAYFRLKRIRPEAWEVDTIRAIDAEFMASQGEDSSNVAADASSLMSRVNK